MTTANSAVEQAAEIWGQILSEENDLEVQIVQGWFLGEFSPLEREELNSIPSCFEHTWLEVDGEIFDPSFSQTLGQPASEDNYLVYERSPIS